MPAHGSGHTAGVPSYSKVITVSDGSSLDRLKPFMLMLMLRNVASSGFSFEDPYRPGVFSLPGCVIASPSYPANLATVDQDYVYNWTRDAAVTATELVHADLPTDDNGVSQWLVDYVRFAERCQQSTPMIGRACYTVDGQARDWSDQSDGPALQTIAVLDAFALLDDATRDVARRVVARHLDYLLATYRLATTSPWEEAFGQSFFARSAQLQCFRRVVSNDAGIAVPAELEEAIGWLGAALETHWDGECYVSVLADTEPGRPPEPVRAAYDPNTDVVLAALYGGVPVTDPKLLATAARLRTAFAGSGVPTCYPVNVADEQRGIGPLIGRYPSDTYDGDVTDETTTVGHPWPLCTNAMAQLYFEVAEEVARGNGIVDDPLAAAFFEQVGVPAASPSDVPALLVEAGERMLRAVVFHSDHLELSEQFDATTGYQKSVANLTWSYASFLSALRRRVAAQAV